MSEGSTKVPVYQDYGFTHAAASHMHVRFMPHVLAFAGTLGAHVRVLDVGCGNGFTCGEFLKRGCRVVGVDLSESGIEIARKAYPGGRFEVLAADDSLLPSLGEAPFDIVVSTEVVEHLYSPREYVRGCFQVLKAGGRFICTTPYHGYLKNLVLSLVNKWDAHANPLWDGGHIKLLEPPHADIPANGNRFCQHPVPRRGAAAVLVDDDGGGRRQAREMTMLEEITPLILTFNEAPNIERTMSRLTWAARIVVVDSFSTDETCDIVRRFKQAEIVQRKFDTFAGQCNFGLQEIRTPWVLSLDADYVLDAGFEEELAALQPDSHVTGYRAIFTYCVHGRRLRASLYPPRTVLYRKDRAEYRDEGHGHRVQIEGRVLPLRSRILHDDRKPLDRWFAEQNRYAEIEARHLLKSREQRAGGRELNAADRVRKLVVLAPWLVFFYTLAGKGLILDGWPGWYYVLQRTLAEIMLSLRLIEARLKP